MLYKDFIEYRFSKDTQVKVYNLDEDSWLNVKGVDFERDSIDVDGYVVRIEDIKDIRQYSPEEITKQK